MKETVSAGRRFVDIPCQGWNPRPTRQRGDFWHDSRDHQVGGLDRGAFVEHHRRFHRDRTAGHQRAIAIAGSSVGGVVGVATVFGIHRHLHFRSDGIPESRAKTASRHGRHGDDQCQPGDEGPFQRCLLWTRMSNEFTNRLILHRSERVAKVFRQIDRPAILPLTAARGPAGELLCRCCGRRFGRIRTLPARLRRQRRLLHPRRDLRIRNLPRSG